MKKLFLTSLIASLSMLCGCNTIHGLGQDLTFWQAKQTATQKDIDTAQTAIQQIDTQKLQIAAVGTFEALDALSKDPNKDNNLYERAATTVLNDDVVPNLPAPTTEEKQKADARVVLAVNETTWKDKAKTAALQKSYQDDIDNLTKINNQKQQEITKLQQLNQQNETEKAKLIATLQAQVNSQQAQMQAAELNKINLIFAGIGAFCVMAGTALLVFTPMKIQGGMLIGLGIFLAPMGLFYTSTVFKWISSIGFGGLFIVILYTIYKSFGHKQNASNNEDISSLFISSILQLQTNNPQCYAGFKVILDNQLAVDPDLKTEIDNRIDAATKAKTAATSVVPTPVNNSATPANTTVNK